MGLRAYMNAPSLCEFLPLSEQSQLHKDALEKWQVAKWD